MHEVQTCKPFHKIKVFNGWFGNMNMENQSVCKK